MIDVRKGGTPVLEFRTREGVSYARRLVLDDKGNVGKRLLGRLFSDRWEKKPLIFLVLY